MPRCHLQLIHFWLNSPLDVAPIGNFRYLHRCQFEFINIWFNLPSDVTSIGNFMCIQHCQLFKRLQRCHFQCNLPSDVPSMRNLGVCSVAIIVKIFNGMLGISLITSGTNSVANSSQLNQIQFDWISFRPVDQFGNAVLMPIVRLIDLPRYTARWLLDRSCNEFIQVISSNQ